MTVRELIEAAPFCDALEIVVREHGHGQWIQGYRISKHAEMWKSEHTVECGEKIKITYGDKAPRLTDGEIRDVMHGYNLPLKIIKKDPEKIPDYIGNLIVCSFQPRNIPSFHREQLTHNEFSMDICCYPDGYVPEVEENKNNKQEQLEGQTSIYDFIGE